MEKIIFFIFLYLPFALNAHPKCDLPARTPTKIVTMPVEHIVVIMQENHSFDNYFGKLNAPEFYGKAIDGLKPEMKSKSLDSKAVHPYHETDFCVHDAAHDWNAEHIGWNFGQNDNFIEMNGETQAMGYYTDKELPYYYALANQFAVADRYFSPSLAPTYPNRFFLYTGTAFGHIKNDSAPQEKKYSQKTIFDELNEKNISWKYYSEEKGAYIKHFKSLWENSKAKMVPMTEYAADLKLGTLPQVVFLESREDQGDEHPPADIRIGQEWVSGQIQLLTDSTAWKTSALFFTYDENGGFFDHVPPPEACIPDQIKPARSSKDVPGKFDRYGLRVPFVAISPFAKHHYVSHKVYDHTSILKFIEQKFGLPALSARDANADGLLDMFDFKHPEFKVATLPKTSRSPASASCKKK